MRLWLLWGLIAVSGCRDDGAASGAAPSASAAPAVAKLYYEDANMPVASALLQRASDDADYLFVASRPLSCEELPRIASLEAEADAAERAKLKIASPESIEMRAAIVGRGKIREVTRVHFGRHHGGAYQLSRNDPTKTSLNGDTRGGALVNVHIDNGVARLVGPITPTVCPGDHVHPGTVRVQAGVSFEVGSRHIEVRDATLTSTPHAKGATHRLVLSSEPIGCGSDPVNRFVPWGIALEWREGAEDHIEVDLMTIGQARYALGRDPKAKVVRNGALFEIETEVRQHDMVAKVSGKVEPTVCEPPNAASPSH